MGKEWRVQVQANMSNRLTLGLVDGHGKGKVHRELKV